MRISNVARATAVWVLVCGGALQAAPPYRVVALTGDAAPGSDAGVVFSALGVGAINESGEVVFTSALQGPGVVAVNDQGIWVQRPGDYSLIAREGASAAGIPGATFAPFSGVSSPYHSDGGAVAFKQAVSGVTATGLWSTRDGSLNLVARTGDTAPVGVGGVNLNSIDAVAFDAPGRVTFTSVLTGTGVDSTNNSAVFSDAGGPLAMVARTSQHAPGTAAGVTWASFNNPRVGENGSVVIRAMLQGPGVATTNDAGIWSNRSGPLSLVVREGQLYPTTSLTMTSISNFAVSSDGLVGFYSSLSSGVSNVMSLVAQTPTGFRVVTQAGQPAPGTTSVFTNFNLNNMLMSGVGGMAHIGFLSGGGANTGNDTGIWSEINGVYQLAAREGAIAPGAGSAVFGDFFNGLFNINPNGQVAFTAALSGPGVTTANDSGLWATDHLGALQLIAREGDLLEVMPGDFRTIASASMLSFTSGVDGNRSTFNSNGELVFWAGFTDGSNGIFVATVPEPATAVLALLAGVGMLAFGRRDSRTSRHKA